jgi:hypothetical protein
MSGPVFMFCALGFIFGRTKGVSFYFHVFRYRTCFRRYRGRRVPFLCFARPNSFLLVPRASVEFSCFSFPNSFSAVPRVSGPVFMFLAPELIFGDTEVVWCRFHVLHSGLVFGGTVGVGTRFHVLRSLTHFRRYRGRPFPFSYFPLPYMFSTVPRASCPIFMFCTTELIFVGTEGVGPVFLFCVPGLIFDGTEGVGFCFHFLSSRTRFRRYRGRLVPFSCLALPNSFSAVPRASGPVFMFCAPDSFSVVPWASAPVFMFYAPELIFGGTEGVPSRFLVFRSRTCFRRYRARRVPVLYFPLPDMFLAVPRASGPVFMFCAPGHVFGGTEGVGSCFHVLRSRIHFRRYRERRVPFSCFALPDSFSTVPRVSVPVFLLCAPGLIFDGTEGVESCFQVLRSRTRFQQY